MTYAKALRQIMRETGTRQAELARRMGTSTAYISQLCTGKIEDPSITKALEVARALGVSIYRFAELMSD